MKYIFCCFIAFTLTLSAQDQRLADSLATIYNSGSYDGDILDLLTEIAINKSDPDEHLKYASILIEKAALDSSFIYLHNGYLEKGNALVSIGNYDQALNAYLTSLRYAQRIENLKGEGKLLISIADTYSVIGNSNNAEVYYEQGIKILRNLNDSISLGSALLNAGDEYFNSGNYELALQYFQESGEIFRDQNYLIGTAYNLGNIGMVYAEQGKDEIAESNINEAINILEELEDYYPISIYLTFLSEIYTNKNDLETAIHYAQRSLDLAKQYGLKSQISSSNLLLAELFEKSGDIENSYVYFKDHITYRDSVKNLETIEKMADLRTDYEVSQKQIEVDLLHERSRNQQIMMIGTGLALLLISLMAFSLYRRNVIIKKTNKVIENEKNRSEKLLLNILPAETAEELKKYGKVKARKFENVTVLFTDFINFTNHSQNLTPEEIVQSIDFYFSKFDEIIGKHGLEKIKTIGDAYMCVAGLPFQINNPAGKAARAALEIAEFVEKMNKEKKGALARFKIRIGMSTGPVVAGVVGTKKFVYDIWGDTVNIASRMESNSESGRINLSESTYHQIKDEFNCDYRGELEVKNKGQMKMYFIKAEN